MSEPRRLILTNSWMAGSGEGFDEITFYIDAEPFGPFHELKALDGMTWGDWVDSEYNTIGIYRELYGDAVAIVYPYMGFNIVSSEGEFVKGHYIISAETTYLVG